MFRTILAVLVATFAVVAGVPAVLAADQDVEQLHKLVSRDEMLVDKNDDKLQIPDDDPESADLEEVDEEEVDEEGRKRKIRYCRCNRITKKCTGIVRTYRSRRRNRLRYGCFDRMKYTMCKACANGCPTKKSKKPSEQLEALNLDSDDTDEDSDDTDDDTEDAGSEEVDEEEVDEEEVDEEAVDEEEVDEEEVDEESRKYCRCNKITKKCAGIVKTYWTRRSSGGGRRGLRVKKCVNLMPVQVCKICANVCPTKKSKKRMKFGQRLRRKRARRPAQRARRP